MRPRRFSAFYPLLLIAAFYAAFASYSGGHALLGAVGDGLTASSDSSPTPTPAHDQDECRFCLSGSAWFTPGTVQCGLLPHLDPTRLRCSSPIAALPAPKASLKLARAPPHALFS